MLVPATDAVDSLADIADSVFVAISWCSLTAPCIEADIGMTVEHVETQHQATQVWKRTCNM